MPRTLVLASLTLVLGACASTQAASGAPRGRAADPAGPPAQVPPRAQEAQPATEAEIGSLRNARVATPVDAQGRELVYLAGELSDAERAELLRDAPNVRIVSVRSREEALAHAAEADAAEARFATPEFLAAAPRLVWVQATSAGVDRYLSNAALFGDERLVLTNLRGVHGPAIADHVFAMVLALARGLRGHFEAQAQGRWDRGGSAGRTFALEGRTLLVVGLGGIGGEVARRAHGFGMRVIATRRTAEAAPAWVEHVGRPDELLALLPRADVVVICVPLTAETERLFDARAFAALKPGALLVNIARGRVVDTDALLEALRSGRLGGAGLDVTEPEPLPPDHPLWKERNVVITPHVASDAELTDARAVRLLRENLRRFGAGEPLLNVVDKRAGY